MMPNINIPDRDRKPWYYNSVCGIYFYLKKQKCIFSNNSFCLKSSVIKASNVIAKKLMRKLKNLLDILNHVYFHRFTKESDSTQIFLFYAKFWLLERWLDRSEISEYFFVTYLLAKKILSPGTPDPR